MLYMVLLVYTTSRELDSLSEFATYGPSKMLTYPFFYTHGKVSSDPYVRTVIQYSRFRFIFQCRTSMRSFWALLDRYIYSGRVWSRGSSLFLIFVSLFWIFNGSLLHDHSRLTRGLYAVICSTTGLESNAASKSGLTCWGYPLKVDTITVQHEN